MHGVVSLLDKVHNEQVENLWRELEVECGLSGIRVTPVPHFSWHVSRDYDENLLRPILRNIALVSQPFRIRTTGIGIFTGLNPVVFISIVKDTALLQLQKWFWERILHAAIAPNPFYAPGSWMPHITLAHTDTDLPRLLCAIEKLAFRPFNWEIAIDNIALISQDEGQIGEGTIRFTFGIG